MSAAEMQYLLTIMQQAESAGHGKKTSIYQDAASQLGVSMQTLLRKLVSIRPSERRKRSDAGTSALTRDEAQLIAAYMLDSRRKNGKRLAGLEDAVEVLRANWAIAASYIDSETGEVLPLSASAISRAMSQYGMHPDMLSLPSPKQTLRSEHPNHVWQIDPSLCVLYYLPVANGEALQVIDETKFYKNKPANIRRIEKERVWRYVITDHASGVIFVHYVLGAESGINLLESFIRAVTKRDNDPFHGIPRLVMVDPGSANTGAPFKNLCRALGITLQVNLPGQPWAKGQVENANNLVEKSFEHRLRFEQRPPTCVEDLNALASKWMAWYNTAKTHRRTQQSRYSVWMTITASQLVIAPSGEIMRSLAMQNPVKRKVNVSLEINFNGRRYSVASVPGIQVGQELSVSRNFWHEDQAGIMYRDENGREVVQMIAAIVADEYGFDISSPVIGESFKSHADTVLDTNRKSVERISMEADTDTEAAQKRKAGATPFSGRLDAMKPITDVTIPDYLPRKGQQLDISAPTVQALRLNHVKAARRLRDRLGDEWSGDHYQWLTQRYPQGIPEDELSTIEAALRRQQPAALRAVGGAE